MDTTRRQTLRRIVVVILLGIALVAGFFTIQWAVPPVPEAVEMAQAIQKLIAQGDFKAAEAEALKAWEFHPQVQEFGLAAAQCAASDGEFQRALQHSDRVLFEDQKRQMGVLQFRAELLLDKLHRLRDAESEFRKILAVLPHDPSANSELAKLCGMTNRRYEAIPFVLNLVRQDQETDLLILLARDKGVINDSAQLELAKKALPDDPRPLLGLAWNASEAGKDAETLELLKQAVKLEPTLPAAWGLLGSHLANSQHFDGMEEWIKNCPPVADSDPQVWLARALWADHAHQPLAAIRCYAELLRRSPDSRRAASRLAQLLEEQGNHTAAEQVQAHLQHMQSLQSAQEKTFSAGEQAGLPELLNLMNRYADAGRMWEALAFCRVAHTLAPEEPEVTAQFDRLNAAVANLPLELTDPQLNPVQSLDLSQYPLPKVSGAVTAAPVAETPVNEQIHFVEQAAAVGLRFRYEDGAQGPRLHMHEITGGGVGVLDFDRDGFPDLFLTQGSTQAPPVPSRISDRLFQNRAGQQFRDVSLLAGIAESGFGQGVCAGDVNSDGFPDLYVANIGANALWVNQGDGTFEEVSGGAGLESTQWTTSCLIADLNRDGHPDLYEVNYLQGDQLFERTCSHPDGSPSQCLPTDFDGASDQLWLNDGQGRFRNATAECLTSPPTGKGLGIAAWSPEPSGPLVVLVANDTTPNNLWVPEAGTPAGTLRLTDRGVLNGIALSSDGKAQGSMGIAVGDVDEDGHIDACITNFLAEGCTFYGGTDGDGFEDRTREVALLAPTYNTLGFGTQLLDADLNGTLDLFIANGHIQDLQRYQKPWRMRPQLHTWQGHRFQEASSQSLGPYFQAEWLARAAARLDWNRDGRDDLVVGHLDDPLALLTNTSSSTSPPLSLNFVATRSARDAIGTTVEFRVGDHHWSRQLIGGGGYQASNENQITWGSTGVHQIDEVTIHWPSGTTQKFAEVTLPLVATVVEGTETLFGSPPR